MEIYAFKRRLQTIVGQEPDRYRAVDIVAEACQKIAELNLDAVAAATVLATAARLSVEERQPGDLLGYLEMEEAVNRRVRSLFDDPGARRACGIPDTDRP